MTFMSRPLDTFAQRLQYARRKRGLTQAILAEAVGLKQSDISKLETGRSQRTTAIAKILRVLRVPDPWLEDGGTEPDWEASVPNVSYRSQGAGARALGVREGVESSGALPDDGLAAVVDDLRELLPEDRERFIADIRARAEQMRKHADMVLRRAGVKSLALGSPEDSAAQAAALRERAPAQSKRDHQAASAAPSKLKKRSR